jgi:hypothetical protein
MENKKMADRMALPGPNAPAAHVSCPIFLFISLLCLPQLDVITK